MCDVVRKTIVETSEMGDSTKAALKPIKRIIVACHKDFDVFRKFEVLIENMKNDKTSFQKIKKFMDWNGEGQHFLDGVVNRLKVLGVDCTVSDTDIILKEVKNRFKDRLGIPLYKDNKAIELWLKGGEVSRSISENHYALCYALEMNWEETIEFFLKYFLLIPFNYKNRIDAIFYYCMINNRSYQEAKNLISKTENFTISDNLNQDTVEIGKQISDIQNDDEFIKYLSMHCFSKEKQYSLARKKIIEIIDYHCEAKGYTIAELYSMITGIHYQKEVSISERKDVLPSEFMRSFPTDRTFLDIKNGKKPESYDTIRKTLIILNLFDYYESRDIKSSNIKEQWVDFTNSMDKSLVECGLSPLYPKNPFDRIILFCAATPNPSESFCLMCGMMRT